MITNPGIEAQTSKALGVVSRALRVFGGNVEPVAVPRFAASRDLEDDLGHGRF